MSNQNYNIELLPDEPVLIFTAYKAYSLVEDQPQAGAEVQQYLDQASEPLYHILDITEASLSLDDVILAANFGARGQNTSANGKHGPVWKHPNIRELIFVTDKKLVNLAVRGLDSLMFGNIQAKVFYTQEEALEYIRVKIAGG